MSCTFGQPDGQRILFMCAHGAMRSPMAAALLTARTGGAVVAQSAGIAPAPDVSPLAATAMREIGLDIAKVRPRRYSPDELAASHVIWLGARAPVDLEGCDVESWGLSDASTDDLPAVRDLRRELEGRIDRLLATWGAPPPER